MAGQVFVAIRDREWMVSVATTPYELTTGLSEVASMPEGTGMLFDLGTDQRYIEIDMSRMLFPLDIIFISSTQGVVGVVRNAEPRLPVYFENTRLPGARFFLEVNAGETEGIEVSDDVVIQGDVAANQLPLSSLMTFSVILLGMTMFSRVVSGRQQSEGGQKMLGRETGAPGRQSSHGSNPVTRRYYGPYLTNRQYGGYSYVEEDPAKRPELWSRTMVDYANPEEVLSIAEKKSIPQISLAGGFWERIGYRGWGEKVSFGEAKRALSKATAHAPGLHSGTSHMQNSEATLKQHLEKEAWEEGLAYETHTEWAEEAERLGKSDIAKTLRQIASDEYRHREALERIIRVL